jgi:hypothetical protein
MLFLPPVAWGQTVAGPDAKLQNNDLYVTFSLGLNEKTIDALKNGMEKEIRFYIDLFRVWNIWPDEFVLGRSFKKTIKADPIKKEFIATSNDGSVVIEKRFRTFETMLDWVVSFRDLKLTNVRELESGRYFVRITVESKIRQLPPVIGYFLVFVSENEFRVVKDSSQFMIEGQK